MWIQMNSTDGLSHAIVNVECVDDSADISRAETVSSPIRIHYCVFQCYKVSPASVCVNCLYSCHLTTYHFLMAHYPYGTY